MPEPVTWTAVGMAAISNVTVWLVILKSIKAKNNGSKSFLNLKPVPGAGEGPICQERGNILTKVETKQESYEEDVKEIRRDIREIRITLTRK